MKTEGERIAEIISHFCDSKADFARKIGERPQTVSNWVSRGAGKNILNRILTLYPEINPTWLLTGEGEMLNTTSRRAPQSDASPINNPIILNVPLVSQYAQAGYLSGYGDPGYMDALPTIPYIVDHEAPGNYVAFEVKGDSMDDGTDEAIKEGDRLLCREIRPDLWAESRLHFRKWDFVIVHEEGILVKRIIDHDVARHTITIHSLNSFYPDKVIDLADVKQIFNVIELQRPRRR